MSPAVSGVRDKENVSGGTGFKAGLKRKLNEVDGLGHVERRVGSMFGRPEADDLRMHTPGMSETVDTHLVCCVSRSLCCVSAATRLACN